MIGSKMFEIWRWEAGIYKEQLEKMIANGNAYRCFLSPEAGCKCVVLSISRFYRSYRWDHFNFWNGNIWRQFLHGGWVLDDLRSWMRWGPRLKGMIRRPNLSHAVIIFIFTPQNVTPWQHEQRTLRPSWCKVLGPMHQRKRCRQGLWHCSEVDRFDRVLKVLNQYFQMFSDVFSLILALCRAPAKNQFMLRTRKWFCRPWLTRASPTSTDSGYPLIGRSKELTLFHSIVALMMTSGCAREIVVDDLVLGEAHWQTPCITSHCAVVLAAVASQKDGLSDQLSMYILAGNCVHIYKESNKDSLRLAKPHNPSIRVGTVTETCGVSSAEVIWNSDDLGGDFVIVRQNGPDLCSQPDHPEQVQIRVVKAEACPCTTSVLLWMTPSWASRTFSGLRIGILRTYENSWDASWERERALHSLYL